MIKQFCLFYEDGINKHWFNSNKKFYFFWALNVLRSPSSRLIQKTKTKTKTKNQQQQLLCDSYFQELVFIWIVTIFNLDYRQSQNYIQSWNSSTLATSWEELTHWKRPWCWEGLGARGEGTTEDEMAGWHHWLDGRESEWIPGVVVGQGGLACCNSWGHKESDMTEWLIWSDLKHACTTWLFSEEPSILFSWTYSLEPMIFLYNL